MASTVPAKSRTLHNFSLPNWKWTKNHTNNHHRGRRPADSSYQQSSSSDSAQRHSPPFDSLPRQSPVSETARRHSPMLDSAAVRRSPMRVSSAVRRSPMRDSASKRISPMRDSSAVRRSPMRDSSTVRQSPMREFAALCQSPLRDSAALPQSPMRDSILRQSPMRDPASELEFVYPSSLKNGFIYDNRKPSAPEGAKHGFHLASSDQKVDDSGKRTDSDFHMLTTTEVRSKILIRLQRTNKPDDIHDEEKTVADGVEVEELVSKTWNLRPRKPTRKQSNANGGAGTPCVAGTSSPENISQFPPAAVNRSDPDGNPAEKVKKQKFSISLSRREIEEDIFAMTGSKPARRPKKRAKIVQKQLDNLFPGLWLPLITADLYKVSEAPAKV